MLILILMGFVVCLIIGNQIYSGPEKADASEIDSKDLEDEILSLLEIEAGVNDGQISLDDDVSRWLIPVELIAVVEHLEERYGITFAKSDYKSKEGVGELVEALRKGIEQG